jgi:fatty acid desaturase
MDYDYGIFNKINHNINIHFVHHLFPLIPHYHLEEANKAIKPLLGEHYHFSPYSPVKAFIIACRSCHFVDNEGDVLFPKSQSSE